LKLSLYIAKRYLFAKKTHNIINIISGVSMISVTIVAMALILVLSVFNGFESLIEGLYNSFDPDIRITVKQGKTFNPATFDTTAIR
jgi:lipoprotein-releasing system permease protein